MRKKRLKGPAPSTFAASAYSWGMVVRPARRSKAMKGVVFQTSIMIMLGSCRLGLPKKSVRPSLRPR